MRLKASGTILMWEGASLWLVATPPGKSATDSTTVHEHHAIQVTLQLRGNFGFELASGHRVSGSAVAVAPDARHSFRLDGAAAHLFIDPDGRAGRAIVSSLFSSAAAVEIPVERFGGTLERLLAASERPQLNRPELIDLARAMIAQLSGTEAHSQADPRVERMRIWAETRLEGSIALEDAARMVGLSPGRGRHLFVEQTGLPFRTYLLWRRLNKAVEFYAAGASLTDAAHASGFSDSAHLSRTFRRMFGLAAAQLRLG